MTPFPILSFPGLLASSETSSSRGYTGRGYILHSRSVFSYLGSAPSQREDSTIPVLPLEVCLLEDGNSFPDVLEGSCFVQGPAHWALAHSPAQKSFSSTGDASVRQQAQFAEGWTSSQTSLSAQAHACLLPCASRQLCAGGVVSLEEQIRVERKCNRLPVPPSPQQHPGIGHNYKATYAHLLGQG